MSLSAFAVLDVADQEEGCAIAEDPRLTEWFRRPKALHASSLAAKPAGSASLAAAIASATTTEQHPRRAGEKERPSLPASLRKSISERIIETRLVSMERYGMMPGPPQVRPVTSQSCFITTMLLLCLPGISLSALRRGCPDRLNFVKRLQADTLQCSLNTNAIELLLYAGPGLAPASPSLYLM